MSDIVGNGTTKSVDDQESVEDTAMAENNVETKENAEVNANEESIGQCEVPTEVDGPWMCEYPIPTSTTLQDEANGGKDTTKSVEDQESVEDTAMAENNVETKANAEVNAKEESIGQCEVPTAFDERWKCVGTVPPCTTLQQEGTRGHVKVCHQEEKTKVATVKEAVQDHHAEKVQDLVQDHVVQHVQAGPDASTQNELRARFAPKVASAGRKSYGILREGLLKSGEALLKEYTSPPLIYKKGMLFNSGQKSSYSYKSPDGDTITAYAVIAEDVQTEQITADVVDGGIGMKHIKVEVKSHQEGPWSYRVVVGGRKS